MQIETLKIFCDLVETKSFSQAAERNFVTQSAVSQQVRGLESKFKRRLLERVRGRRELHLTQEGEAFYEASREVLQAYGQLEESMRQLSGTVGGTVRVATETALTWAGTCEPGNGLGIAGDEVLIVAPDVAAAATGLIDLLLGAGGELITVLVGQGIEADPLESALRAHVHDHHPGIELAMYRTGHRGDALMIGVE